MKSLLSLLALVLVSGIAAAQSYSGMVEYNKTQQPALICEFPFPPGMVEDAIKNKMEKLGYSGKEAKGFRSFKGAKIAEISNEAMLDLYFKVEKKSRKEKDASMVYLLLSKGYENFMTDAADGPTMNNAKTFLNNLRATVEAYSLELEITTQEEAVKKAEKKFNGLVDDGQSLEKKKRNIEKEIEENKTSQTRQKEEWDKQKQILDTLRARRKS